MKRSGDTADTMTHTNRRALLVHNNPQLLAEPDVVAFLDDKLTDWDGYDDLVLRFVLADEPALLVELVHASQTDIVCLSMGPLVDVTPHTLPAGFLDHVLQHLSAMPSVESLEIGGADLTAQTCTLLQTALQAPNCNVTELTLTNCCLVGAQVVFPLHVPGVTEFKWFQTYKAEPGHNELTRILPSLAGWSSLATVHLFSELIPFNFAVLAQLLQTNRCIKSLYLLSRTVFGPGAPGALDQQLNPTQLFDVMKRNQTSLIDVSLCLEDFLHPTFNEQMLNLLADCLTANTTLESVTMPGIQLCSDVAKQAFIRDLWRNHTLISLEPQAPFGLLSPRPIRRNHTWHYRFSPEFVIGAAEAFMRLMGAPVEVGKQVGSNLVSTSIDRIYCGLFISIVCKATHANAVRLRSACLRDALIRYIAVNDEATCKRTIETMARNKVELLPADKAAVVTEAGRRGTRNCLPAGYAG
jgi:hypothetical protein